MFGLLKKLFGTHQSRLIRKYSKIVERINAQELLYQQLPTEAIIRKTTEFETRLKQGETADDLLIEAYAVVKNACRRLIGTEVHVSGYTQKWDMIPYDVQMIGAIAMHYGTIAEMQTGEGKTLTAAMPLYLNALSGNPVHLVTVNDYLAKRDCEWIGVIFRLLGLKVAYLTNETPPHERKAIYDADILYGTASEFGFDYLRDNSMAMRKEEQCQRGHFFAIIDEADSILIDEARTPLIISGPSSESRQMYDELKAPVAFLVKVQRELCSKIANEAKRSLDLFPEDGLDKLSKEQKEQISEALKKLWLVSKGCPCHKVLKKVKENPDFRVQLDQWETYFHSEQNKEEKATLLSQLYIIVDEKGNEYELTDQGIATWGNASDQTQLDDFVMLDLGYEYAKIDQDSSLTNQQKMEKKSELRALDATKKERSHNVRQLFRAHLLMERDIDYIVQDGKIIIIDENTGRPQPGRRFSDGLHQAIEAKESVKIQQETQTYATITLQNYFRMYKKLAGMTGTAITEATELKQVYRMGVLQIPTHLKCQRIKADDEIYMTEREKYHAILKEIQQEHAKGRPILIGTDSVEASEKLSRILKQHHLEHTILNAKHHEKEAEIVAEAGRRGAITLATNMAGRGTDIKLRENVASLGGLHVIGTTRHQSRRIDLQLEGRGARQGDLGSSKFFISFEDPLMRLFASPRITALLQRYRPKENERMSAKILNSSIKTAQERIEQRNYAMRKHTLEYDDVMNKHRMEIYGFRNEILGAPLVNEISSFGVSITPMEIGKEIIHSVCETITKRYMETIKENKQWDSDGLLEWLVSHFPVSFEKEELLQETNPLNLSKELSRRIIHAFEQKISFQIGLMTEFHKEAPPERAEQFLQEIVRNIMLRRVDDLWQRHLLAIDHLRSDVYLRSFAQKDPLVEFKQEAFHLFDGLSIELKSEIAKDLFRFEMAPPRTRSLQEMEKELVLEKEIDPLAIDETPEPVVKPLTIKQEGPRLGRNELCPCGSGKKHKKCCGIAETV